MEVAWCFLSLGWFVFTPDEPWGRPDGPPLNPSADRCASEVAVYIARLAQTRVPQIGNKSIVSPPTNCVFLKVNLDSTSVTS